MAQLLSKYWLKFLRKSYPWSTIGLLAWQWVWVPDAEARLLLQNRIHHAWIRVSFPNLIASMDDFIRPEYWMF